MVIQSDGKQHYSDGDRSSPKKYLELVVADRSLTLNGYKVFRLEGSKFSKDNIMI